MNITLAGPFPQAVAEKLQAMHPHDQVSLVSTQEEYDLLTDAECIVVRVLKTTEAVITNNQELRAVIRWGAGYDSVDVEAAGQHGVLVANTPGVNAYAVAELTLSMMILLSRRVLLYRENVLNGKWDRATGAGQAMSLRGKTVGLVGGGAIGQAVARLVRGCGAQVRYFDANRLPWDIERELGMDFSPLDRLLRDSDVLSLHVPLVPGTHHLLGADQLNCMKPNAYVINTARGGLIDEAALVDCLKNSRLAGAGLDCVEDEQSVIVQELLACPNVIITPHIGGTVADLADAMIENISAKIDTLSARGYLDDVVNAEWMRDTGRTTASPQD